MNDLAPRLGRRDAAAWFRLAPADWWRGAPLEAIEAILDDDETRAELEAVEAARGYPRATLARLRHGGLGSVLAGDDATIPRLCALNAMTARRSGSLAITLGVNALALLPLYVAADDALRARVTARVRDGAFCGLLLSELAHGSNLLRIDATGAREGDAWVLRGEKHMINGGTHHDVLVALVRTRPRAEGASSLSSRGDLSLVVVERDASVEALPRWNTLPAHAADIAGVRFHATRAPLDAVVGGEGNGFGVVQRTLTVSRGGIGALASGAASDAFDRAWHHARTRDVYGEPIAGLGAIADHLMRIAALESLAAAASIKSAALSNALGPAAAHATAVAKVACCSLAEEAVDEGRRVLGARALVEEAGYARLVRDVLLYGVFDGTSHVVLDQLQWRLAQFAVAEPTEPAEHLAFARDAWRLPARPIVDSVRERARVYLAPIDRRLAALASLSSRLAIEPLVAASVALLDFVRTRRAQADGAWDRDQATRFEAAAALADLETLAALIELADPPRREALGLPALADPGREEAIAGFALAWFGGRTISRVERLTQADLSAPRRMCVSGLDCARRDLRMALALGSGAV